jgi:RNA polymerase sigma-70 factor (ECF subfamily)
MSETTQLLRAWAGGDEQALPELVPRVHREPRKLAGHFLKNERAGNTLQATDLVQEVYLRLVDVSQMDWQHRAHFFAVSATLMRRILLDRARRRMTAKRGGRAPVLNLDQAPNALAGVDPRKARIVELRFFGGLSVKETAAVVKVSPDTVMRDWQLARAWLLTELRGRT